MKKLNLIVLTGLFLSLCISSQAQEEKGKEAKKATGIRAGYQSSKYVKGGEDLTGTTSYGSFYVGAFRDQRLFPTFYLGGGVEYYQNGARWNDDNKIVFHYVGIPLYAKAKVGPVFAVCGFEPSFRVSEKQYGLTQIISSTSKKSNWFDAPFFLGAGLKFLFITVEARYHWGTVNVYNNAYSQYLQIGAGLSF